MGPYMVIYFSHIGFSASQIGTVIATLALTNALSHIPAGQLVDKCERRRELMVTAVLLIALSILAIMYCHNFEFVLLVQVLIGVASALIPPVIGAISLGLVGHDDIAVRAGRNDSFNHAGNVSVAATIGISGMFLPMSSMLWLFIALCLFTTAAVLTIRHKDINEAWAKGLHITGQAEKVNPVGLKILLANRDFIIFLFAVLLFHLTNSALLPVVIQKIIKVCPAVTVKTIPLWSTSCIIMAELVMIFSANLAGRLANKGRKNLFLSCYLLVALRALLFAIIMQPVLLVSAQFLDGMSAGIYGVVCLTILADLAYGSGRFNLSQGIFNAFTAIGIAASNFLAGILIDTLGFSSTCLIATFVTLITFVFLTKLIPETKDRPPLSSLPVKGE